MLLYLEVALALLLAFGASHDQDIDWAFKQFVSFIPIFSSAMHHTALLNSPQVFGQLCGCLQHRHHRAGHVRRLPHPVQFQNALQSRLLCCRIRPECATLSPMHWHCNHLISAQVGPSVPTSCSSPCCACSLPALRLSRPSLQLLITSAPVATSASMCSGTRTRCMRSQFFLVPSTRFCPPRTMPAGCRRVLHRLLCRFARIFICIFSHFQPHPDRVCKLQSLRQKQARKIQSLVHPAFLPNCRRFCRCHCCFQPILIARLCETPTRLFRLSQGATMLALALIQHPHAISLSFPNAKTQQEYLDEAADVASICMFAFFLSSVFAAKTYVFHTFEQLKGDGAHRGGAQSNPYSTACFVVAAIIAAAFGILQKISPPTSSPLPVAAADFFKHVHPPPPSPPFLSSCSSVECDRSVSSVVFLFASARLLYFWLKIDLFKQHLDQVADICSIATVFGFVYYNHRLSRLRFPANFCRSLVLFLTLAASVSSSLNQLIAHASLDDAPATPRAAASRDA